MVAERTKLQDSVCLSICLTFGLSVCLADFLSVCLSVFFSVCLFFLYFCLSVCLSVHHGVLSHVSADKNYLAVIKFYFLDALVLRIVLVGSLSSSYV